MTKYQHYIDAWGEVLQTHFQNTIGWKPLKSFVKIILLVRVIVDMSIIFNSVGGKRFTVDSEIFARI